MEYKNIIFEVKDRIALITLNRPEVMNSMSIELKHELADAVTRLESDSTVWGAIITGNGRAFSSGTDINDFPQEAETARKITAYAQRLFNRIENLEKPVIAAVNGYALGGGFELALVCDIRVASEKAKLGFPEVKVGAIPCYGGTQRLTRLAGAGIAKEMIYTGRMVTASEAMSLHIINYAVPAGTELEKAQEIMGVILENSPMAVAYSKLCINRGPEYGLEYALDMEQNLVSLLVPTHDLKEGAAAFLEKRKPVYLNK